MDVSRMAPWSGISGTREEAPGKSQDTLEDLRLPAALGAPQDSPRRAGRSGWGEGSLGWMDRWTDK